MKVIDLLNKIAKGEEIPKKIRYENVIYELNPITKKYIGEYMKNILIMETITIEELNDEIEVIEDTPKEDKKIEKITLDDWVEFTTATDINRIDYMFNKNSSTFVNKINEIIDKINGE